MKGSRALDACINRASEGLRFLEDTARFRLGEKELTSQLRSLRHMIRQSFREKELSLTGHRDARGDVGRIVSENSRDDTRKDLKDACTANFKRAQESFRSIEEFLKTEGEYRFAKKIESHRFSLYTLEKRVLDLLRPKLPGGIYGILGEQFSCGRTNARTARAMADAGIDIIQYREKLNFKTRKQMYEECREIRKITKDAGIFFIVNDFPDIAISVGADGIHSGQDDLPAPELKKLAPDMMVGISTHSPQQAETAVAQGADYIGAGPIFATWTKEDVCDPVGLSYLEYVARNINIPFVAIGGIKLHNLEEVLSRGARTICLVTEITGADSIGDRIREIRNLYREHTE